MNLLLITIGGGLGSLARYLSSEAILRSFALASKFPLGTFFVNVFGSLLAGIIYFFVVKNFDNFDPNLKNFLLAGFLGGFTTFSAFSLDFFRLATAGQYLQAFAYIFFSILLAILALFFGFYASKLIFS
jgi:CrcB protein